MRLALAPVFTLLTLSGLTLLLSQSSNEVAQRPPANIRFFQMALFTYEGHGTNWQSTDG